ncbi:hypothetical protein M2160_004932 [Streptomyces sp. SAI-117]|nr:hypothetical protein [Streptomyces sp. SAI-117]
MPRRGGPLGRIRRPRPAGQVPCRGCHWGLPGGPCAGGADAVARSCRNGSGPGADHSGMPRRGGPLGRIRRPRPARQVPCRGCHWGLPGGPCADGADAVARSCRNGSGPGAGHSGMPRRGGPLPVVAQTRREQSHSSTASDPRTGAGVAATSRADAAHAWGEALWAVAQTRAGSLAAAGAPTPRSTTVAAPRRPHAGSGTPRLPANDPVGCGPGPRPLRPPHARHTTTTAPRTDLAGSEAPRLPRCGSVVAGRAVPRAPDVPAAAPLGPVGARAALPPDAGLLPRLLARILCRCGGPNSAHARRKAPAATRTEPAATTPPPHPHGPIPGPPPHRFAAWSGVRILTPGGVGRP